MATTDLKLDEPGSLPKPGPLGRLLRLLFGVLCLWYVSGLILVAGNLIAADGRIQLKIWNGILPGFFLVSYVVNIGFSRAWRKWPTIVSGVGLAIIAGTGFAISGTIDSALFARGIWIWELYVFSHLGAAFVVAAIIGTPGCEMRAFHDLFSRLSGVPTKEHFCPVGPLNAVDRWEWGKRGARGLNNQ